MMVTTAINVGDHSQDSCVVGPPHGLHDDVLHLQLALGHVQIHGQLD